MWALNAKNPDWGSGLWHTDANFHPLQSHAASQLSHLAWCWPHPFTCYPWSQSLDHTPLILHKYQYKLRKSLSWHIGTILGPTQLTELKMDQSRKQELILEIEIDMQHRMFYSRFNNGKEKIKSKNIDNRISWIHIGTLLHTIISHK